MPLKILKQIDDQAYWGLWEINEPQSQLEDQAEKLLTATDLEALKKVSHPVKRKEFISSRLLTKTILEDRGLPYTGIQKVGRKPYLQDRSFHLSISHAYPFAGVLINKMNTCGIDIELTQDRLWRIAHRFLKAEELLHVGGDGDQLCHYWCAKEALYKKFGHLNLSFKDCMTLKDLEDRRLEGRVQYKVIDQKVELEITRYENAWIVYSLD